MERTGHLPWRYVLDPYRYRRRPTRVVMVGNVGVGGQNPIRIQSMTTTDTMDTDATVAQVVRLVRAGCEIVRITAPTVEDARNLGAIRRALHAKGIRVPLVADIHFSPAAAMEAAEHVDKVRINPGNFADSKRFAVREYTDQEYQAELNRIEERFAPLVEKCKARGIAMRIGTNHGSLSDRIMNRFGDTPLGMVESALEFARICHKYGYHDLIFSMKASNPKVMIQAYRLLAARLDELGWNYPFHLGVTEAGNGEDGRIKSAIGIGSLLEDGIGDTIRVSLTEDPEYEVPVAFALARPYQPGTRSSSPAPRDRRGCAGDDTRPALAPAPPAALPDTRDPYHYARRASRPVAIGSVAAGSGQTVRVVHTFPGPLSTVPDAPARALALAMADGLVVARPDALAVRVEEHADLAALAALRAALDEAGQELPLIVETPAATAALAADRHAARDVGGYGRRCLRDDRSPARRGADRRGSRLPRRAGGGMRAGGGTCGTCLPPARRAPGRTRVGPAHPSDRSGGSA
jgi:(E)-4-hydroxy-3-methylbut-2-enyl-diphosphate synthase